MIIGLYDSGLGGLSVWRELRKLNVKLIYFGDTAHVPYGEKTPDQLVSYFWEIQDFLQSRGCEGIVIACNTASVLVLPEVHSQVTLPVLGIIEAAVEGCLGMSKGRLGVLATPATVASGVYQRAFSEAKPQLQVFMQSAPQLAPLVEQGKATAPETREIVAHYLAPLGKQNIDTLLLACTHYPFLRPLIEELMGPKVQIVDPAPILVQKVGRLLGGKLYEFDHHESETEFWVSAHPEQFQAVAESLLQEQISPVGLHQLLGEKLS